MIRLRERFSGLSGPGLLIDDVLIPWDAVPQVAYAMLAAHAAKAAHKLGCFAIETDLPEEVF